MKKLLVILAALFAMTSAAQEKFKMVGRAGYSFDSMSGDYTTVASGFDIGFGFNHYLGGQGAEGLFWGLEAQGVSMNAHVKPLGESVSCLGIVGEPRIGYKVPIGNSMFVSPYLGIFAGYKFTGKGTSDSNNNHCRYKAKKGLVLGIDAGVEFFFTKGFFANLHIKKSFREDAKLSYHYEHDYILYVEKENGEEKFSAMKVVLGIGYEF